MFNVNVVVDVVTHGRQCKCVAASAAMDGTDVMDGRVMVLMCGCGNNGGAWWFTWLHGGDEPGGQ